MMLFLFTRYDRDLIRELLSQVTLYLPLIEKEIESAIPLLSYFGFTTEETREIKRIIHKFLLYVVSH